MMKIEFKKSELQANLDVVTINDAIVGEFITDVSNQSFLFVPAKGDRILLSRVTYEEACKLLGEELTQLYAHRCAMAA
jgi:hypothetical protein